MKKLIINADDFGLDDETVDCTIRGFETGKLTSATIMAGMPATERAVAFARHHPEFSFGVHLCLVDEKPLSDPATIPSLIDPTTGRLWPTRKFILRNFLALVKVEELVTEMRAQIRSLQALGLTISHLDGHGHNHRLPQAIKALKIVAAELTANVCPPAVRRTQDLFVGCPGLLSRAINRPMQRRLAGHFRMTDHFLMAAGHTENPRWFSEAIAQLPDGTTEIGIHPGFRESWRRLDCEECFRFDFSGLELINYQTL